MPARSWWELRPVPPLHRTVRADSARAKRTPPMTQKPQSREHLLPKTSMRASTVLRKSCKAHSTHMPITAQHTQP